MSLGWCGGHGCRTGVRLLSTQAVPDCSAAFHCQLIACFLWLWTAQIVVSRSYTCSCFICFFHYPRSSCKIFFRVLSRFRIFWLEIEIWYEKSTQRWNCLLLCSVLFCCKCYKRNFWIWCAVIVDCTGQLCIDSVSLCKSHETCALRLTCCCYSCPHWSHPDSHRP